MSLLLLCALLAADKPAPLSYLRPDGDKYVAAGSVSVSPGTDGTVITSRTQRPDEKMLVTLRFDKDGKLTSADAVQENTRKAVTLTVGEKGAGLMKRGGITDIFKDLPANPLVTAGPDWIGAVALLRRYDSAKGGKQELTGFWIDPVHGMEKVTYTIERKASETLTIKDKEVKLERCRVKLHAGEATVWADGDGRVVRFHASAAKAVPVVLEGFEDATKGLKP
jgi:hypothetical protein